MWKDTVLESLPFLLLNDLFPIDSEDKIKELYSRVDRMREMAAKAQAKISFKAGISEVVEWIKFEYGQDVDEPYIYIIQHGYEKWQAQLKVWGIK